MLTFATDEIPAVTVHISAERMEELLDHIKRRGSLVFSAEGHIFFDMLFSVLDYLEGHSGKFKVKSNLKANKKSLGDVISGTVYGASEKQLLRSVLGIKNHSKLRVNAKEVAGLIKLAGNSS